jgi:hypothetical protein
MPILQVFDPPLCCSSGVCGPTVDPALPRFAADLEWLKSRGVMVLRYNLAQEPLSFAQSETVRNALQEDDGCLPLVLVDGRVVSRRIYPAREELARALGLGTAARSESPSSAPIPAECGERPSCCGPRAGSGPASSRCP